MSPTIAELVSEAINIIDQNWERCDKETGEECKGAQCDFPEHRVMVILADIADENNRS